MQGDTDKMKLEKQLEFDFMNEMRAEDREDRLSYERSFNRDVGKIRCWLLAGMAIDAAALLYVTIQNYL